MVETPTTKSAPKPPANPTSKQEDTKDTDDLKESEPNNNLGNATSPEGILMLTVAVLFDAIGLIPAVGTVSDIIAAIVFGSWAFLIRDEKKIVAKFVISLILEAIPVVSDVAPFVSLIGILIGAKLPTSWIGFTWAVLNNG